MLPAISAMPNLNRKRNFFRGVVAVYYLQLYRHRDLSLIFQGNQIASGIGFNGRNSQIDIAIAKKPAFPEIIQVFSSYIFNVVEKIIGLWVFIGPGLYITFKGIVKTFMAQNV